MNTAPLTRTIDQFTGRRNEMDRKTRNLEAARRCVDRLDRNADLGPEDQVRPETISLGHSQTLDTTLTAVASWCSLLLGEYHGLGSWHASHCLRNVEEVELRGMLICLGASHFTIEQWLDDIRSRIVSLSFRGGCVSPEIAAAGEAAL